MIRSVAVVGAGLTAATAAAALRQEGFDGPVTLIGDEPHLPYERPPLSKERLRGEQTLDDALVHPWSWYAEHEITTLLGRRAARVLPAEQAVELDDGRAVVADAVLLATGGRPRALPGCPPAERILYLRTIEDADRLAGHLGPGRRIVLIGTGFVGAEVAASARALGTEVVALELLEVPLEHLLGIQMGQVIADLHREQGVDLRTGTRVETVAETADGIVVTTAAGDRIRSDAVVVGIGVVPNVEVAEASGVVTDNGIVVDEHCRTSIDGVSAAGDVANHWHPLHQRRLRVEHYDCDDPGAAASDGLTLFTTNALAQGAAAARSILGRGRPYADPHWFWSDQYDHNLQYAGHVDRWDQLILRGDPEARNATAFYLRGGTLQAAFGINRGRDVRVARRLIARRATPDPGALHDIDTDLRTLLQSGQPG